MTEDEIMNMTQKEWKNLYTKEQCKDCYYKMSIYYGGKYGKNMCGYCYLTGHRRNSLPPNCDKYRKRRKNFRRRCYEKNMGCYSETEV